MKRKILYLSIVMNFVFVCAFTYNWQTMQKKHEYLKFRSSATSISNFANVPKNSVCFLGNSITANWVNLRTNFFLDNDFINKGIGGQTSTQLLLRFQQDVIGFSPSIVVLNTGINDIGEGDGFYNQTVTLQNIQSMIDICKANHIELLITSVLPATKISKNRFSEIDLVQSKIEELNKEIRKLTKLNALEYVDYNTKLKNSDGTFNEIYTFDGIHPNELGYKVMETEILKAINKFKNIE